MNDSPGPQHPEVPEAWTLDDFQNMTVQRRRFTPKRGHTDPVHFKCDSFNLERIERIVASRIDPELTTKSDVIQDAIHLWLQNWDETYPDGANGTLRYEFQLRELERKVQYRNDFISRAESSLEALRNDGDVSSLRSYMAMLTTSISDWGEDLPPKHKQKVEAMIDNANRLLESATGKVEHG